MAYNENFGNYGHRKNRLSLLTPQEDEDFLTQLANGAMSAVGLVGNVLDTPGSFVRTALAGENPFESIFDTSKRVGGRDLLERLGILQQNEEGLDLGDILGFGAEVVTDPLILVGPGVTKAGQVAKDIGKFPARSIASLTKEGGMELGKRTARRMPLASVLDNLTPETMKLAEVAAEKRGTTLAALADEPMRKSIGVGLPFQENAFTFDLPGAGMRAKAMDKLGFAARASWPGRQVTSMFDAASDSLTSLFGQETAKRVHADLGPEQARAQARSLKIEQDLHAAGVTDLAMQRNLAERYDPTSGKFVTPEEAVYKNVPMDAGEDQLAYEARTKPVVDALRSNMTTLDKNFEDGVKRGFYTVYDKHETGYAPREATWKDYGRANWKKARSKDLKDLPATAIDDVLRDPEIQELGKLLDENPLDPDVLGRAIPSRVSEALENMGFDNTDLVDWQAYDMLNHDPQRAAWNATADAKQGLQPLKDVGFTEGNAPFNEAVEGLDRPEMARTVHYKPRVDEEIQNQLIRKIDAKRGHNVADWAEMPTWAKLSGELPSLRKELDDTMKGAVDVKPIDVQIAEATAELRHSEDSLEQFHARKSDLDARDMTAVDDRINNEELESLAKLRASADRGSYLRAKIKRLEERRAAGNLQPNTNEIIDHLNERIGQAEIAQANLRAMKLRTDTAKALARRVNDVPPEALATAESAGHPMFGNAPMYDFAAKEAKDIERRVVLDHSTELGAANLKVDLTGQVNPDEYGTFDEWMDAIGIDRSNQTKRSAYARHFTETTQKHGTVPPEVAQNIVGPKAVATSGIRSDEVAAKALRQDEIQKLIASKEKLRGDAVANIERQVAEGRLSGADGAKAIDAVHERYRQIVSQEVADLNNAPLPDTSAVGNVKRAREHIVAKARQDANDAYANGLIGKEDLEKLDTQIATFERGKGSLGPEADRLLAAVKAEHPIPNDGLLQMRNWYIPKDVIEAAKNIRNFHFDPRVRGDLEQFLDRWRGVLKAHFTLPHVAFHSRNSLGMASMYASLGARDPRHGAFRGFMQPWLDAFRVMQGKGLSDAESMPVYKAMGLTGKDAERQLLADLSAHGSLRGAGDLIEAEGIEPSFFGNRPREHKWGTTPEEFIANVPGTTPMDAKYITAPAGEAKKRIAADSRGRIRGGITEAVTNFIYPERWVPTAVGGRLSNTLENVGRSAAVIALLRQGKTVEEAAKLMRAAFVDYSAHSKWEKMIAKRIIPFYSFSRHAIPYAIKNLMEHPAGPYAQTVRAINSKSLRDDADFIPPQLAGTLAIPLGKEKDGKQRFLTSLDTPVESISKLIVPGNGIGGTVQNTLRNLVAQSDPTLKFVLESAFGKSSFTGRNMADTDSLTGRIAAGMMGEEKTPWKNNVVDTFLSNTPGARYLSQARTALDSRKGIGAKAFNVFSGGKLTDLDLNKARAIQISESLKDLMRDAGGKTRIDVSFSKADLAEMTPQERSEAEKLNALMAKLRKDAKNRKGVLDAQGSK